MTFKSKSALILLGVLVVIAIMIGYFAWKSSRTSSPSSRDTKTLSMRSKGGAANSTVMPHDGVNTKAMDAKVEALAKRLEENPDEGVQSWVMLSRSYFLQGRYAKSADAYAEAVKRAPNDSHLLADYAEAFALAQGRGLWGEPEKIAARGVLLDPKNVKALGLAGRAAFDNGDYAAAIKYWKQILPLVPQDSEFARKLSRSIADAGSRMSDQRQESKVGTVPAASKVNTPE